MIPGVVAGQATGSPGGGAELWTFAGTATMFWVDCSDGSSLTLESGAASQVNDLSGNGYDVTQATASNRPTLQTAVQNGLNVLRFDGVNDYLSRVSSMAIGQNVSELVCIAIRRHTTVPAAAQQFLGTARFAMNANASGFAGGTAKRLDADSSTVASDNIVVSTSFDLHVIHANFVNNVLTVRINGTVRATATISGSGNTSNTALTALYLGSNFAGSANFRGDLGELAIMHDSADLTRGEGYLSHKWGLVSKLDASHPYKVDPPYV